MRNQFITFTNLKGGTGKTTLCSLFATYLALCDIPVVVIDADTQLSLWKNRRDDLEENPDAGQDIPWKVYSLPVDNNIQEQIERLKKIPAVVVVDCPGNIDNKNLQYIFRAADMAIIPFRFDRMNVRETASFCDIFRKISKAEIMFLPNMVTQYDDKREALRTARYYAMDKFFGKGRVLPGIPECLAVRDTDTLDMYYKTKIAVRGAFTEIVSRIKETINS